jgi:hypothetical protein
MQMAHQRRMPFGDFHVEAITMQRCDLTRLPRRYGRERQMPEFARKGPVMIASNGSYPDSCCQIRQYFFDPFALRRAGLGRVDEIAEKD